MKKNLRIVSVAAAALLAVAPVAASTVSTVNAASSSAITSVGLGKVELSNGDVVTIKPNISLNTSVGHVVDANISVSFSATVNGTTATSNFTPNASEVSLWKTENNTTTEIKPDKLNEVVSHYAGADGTKHHATFQVKMTKVGLNFGTQNANKKITLATPTTDGYLKHGSKSGQSIDVTLDRNGAITLDEVVLKVVPKDFANPAIVNWHEKSTGAVVTSGSVDLHSGSDAGMMNVSQVINAVHAKYYAENDVRPQSSVITWTNNIKEALKAMNIDVNAQGWFQAPKSFTFNMTATANNNEASKTLAVTVNVPNGKDVTPATVPSQSKTIMHNAYFYDKDAKRVGTDKVTRYNTVTVAMNKTKFSNGIEYYEVIENGKATGKFINADNIDGTKRTLKHNAYVYKTSKKRANKVTLKKGTEVTTYGSAYTFKNGKQYYKIGNDTEKTYVKVVNFN